MSLFLVVILHKAYKVFFFFALLLFLFYINTLAFLLNDNAGIAFSLDDISILTTDCKEKDATVSTQSIIDSLLIWSQNWKLNLNTDKSEVCPFSTCSNDSTWKPALFIGIQKIWINMTPCVLGVSLELRSMHTWRN